METIDKYRKELEEETKIDALNLRDVQMKLPAIKHKWVARLIQHKIELKKTKDIIIKAKETIVEQQLQNAKVKLSKPTLLSNAENNETVLKLKARVIEEEFVVMYLEKVEKVLSQITFDIKNLTEIMKLEQL